MSGLICRLLATIFVFVVIAAAWLCAQGDGARVPFVVPKLPTLSPAAPAGILPALGNNLAAPIIDRHLPVLEQMIRSAGMIFSGRVTKIARAKSPSAETPGCTAITFHVDAGIRGVSENQELTIHEWAELWQRGERYRVGERVLLFLYPPGKLGLTSAVSGGLGRFEINSGGGVAINPLLREVLVADPLPGTGSIVPYSDFARAVRRASAEGDAR